MNNSKHLDSFVTILNQTFKENTLRKLVLSKFNKASGISKITITPIIMGKKTLMKWVTEFPNQHTTENHTLADSIDQLSQMVEAIINRDIYLYSQDKVVQLKASKKGSWQIIIQQNKSEIMSVAMTHNREKKYIIAETTPFLQDLGISSSNGKVHASMQKKYRQINHFIELLLPHLSHLKEPLNIVDFGSGYGYLTFALYYYLKELNGQDALMTGVELRSHLVDTCNEIASKNHFDSLNFIEGDIANNSTLDAQVVIALHACDTATDLAIVAAVKSKAQLIVLAPCCQKQVRKSMQITEENRPFLKHGIFLERTAEMMTDTLRCLYLEKSGYKVKVTEFIGLEHTPKNVMIIAEKNKPRESASNEIEQIKVRFGIKEHFLDDYL